MRFFKCTLLTVMAICASLTASAQITEEAYQEALDLGYRPYPYSFVQVQGGVGATFTNKAFSDLMSPTASVAYGRFFGSGVGARLHVNGWQSKGGFKSIDDTYTFNYINTNADLLLNLTNIFSKSNNHLINVILVGGVGVNYAWGNDDLTGILASGNLPSESTSNAWGKGTDRESLLSHNIRAGILLDFNFSKNWSVGLEVDANSLSDRFNSKYSNRDDWMLTAQLGVTYKFGHKAPRKPDPIIEKKVEVPPPPVVEEVEEVKEEEKPVEETTPPPPPVEVKKEPMKVTIYYAESHRDLETDNQESKLKQVVDWAEKHPEGTIRITGYADKGTGIPERNLKYSQERAAKVKRALIDEGVFQSQIKYVQGLGDTVQPYPENDDNRCVIIECIE